MPTSEVSSYRGAAHCDWETVTFLHLGEDRQFVRDPGGVIAADQLTGTFAAGVAVPGDARDTGYRQDDRRLWLDASGDDVYVELGGTAERWPRAHERLACR